jgi:hypothetical protein
MVIKNDPILTFRIFLESVLSYRTFILKQRTDITFSFITKPLKNKSRVLHGKQTRQPMIQSIRFHVDMQMKNEYIIKKSYG